MDSIKLSQIDLDQYSKKLENNELSAKELFEQLKSLYNKFGSNMESLMMLDHGFEVLRINKERINSKKLNEREFEAIKLKLSKLQEEQNSEINVNSNIEELKELKIQHDSLNEEIENKFKQQSFQLNQLIAKAINDSESLKAQHQEVLEKKYGRVRLITNVSLWLFLIGFAFIVDYINSTLEASATMKAIIPSFLNHHFVFILFFTLIGYFIADKIKDSISHYISKFGCKKSFQSLTDLFKTNELELQKKESAHGMTEREMFEQLIKFNSSKSESV